MSDYHILTCALNWAAAIPHQGRRVLELQERNTPPKDEEAFLAWAARRQSELDLSHVEDQFFVIAVSHCTEHLCELHQRGLLSPDVSESFLTAAGESKVVRNIREHYLEYLKGGGRQKNKNHIKLAMSFGQSMSIDASSVLVSDSGRLIGGRINVQVLMHEAIGLIPKLLSARANILRSPPNAASPRG